MIEMSFGTTLRVFLFTVGMSLLIMHPEHSIVGQSGYSFAYIVITDMDEVYLETIDSANPSNPPETRQVPLPDGHVLLSRPVLSANGEWLAYFTTPANRGADEAPLIRLFNVLTGELRDLGQYYPVRANYSDLYSSSIAWSPDNRYLALNLYQDNIFDIFLYSVADGALVNLTNDNAFQYGLAWSPDSARIATAIEDCTDPLDAATCIRAIEIVAIADGAKVTSIDLQRVVVGWSDAGDTACELTWSPNGQLLGFVSFCAGMDATHEVYIWNLTQNSVTQVTNFTIEAFQSGGSRIAEAQYALAWGNAQTLLIGTRYMLAGMPDFATQTSVYSVSESELSPLSEDGVQEWAINPLSNDVAARLSLPVTNSTSDETSGVNGSVQVFSLDFTGDNLSASALNSATTLPAGCTLTWSPDGEMLAYGISQQNNCLEINETIILFNKASGAVQEHNAFQEETSVSDVFPIGWVAR